MNRPALRAARSSPQPERAGPLVELRDLVTRGSKQLPIR